MLPRTCRAASLLLRQFVVLVGLWQWESETEPDRCNFKTDSSREFVMHSCEDYIPAQGACHWALQGTHKSWSLIESQ